MTVTLKGLTIPFDRDESGLPGIVARRLHMPRRSIRHLRILKKSLDSRAGRKPRYSYAVAIDCDPATEEKLLKRNKVAAYVPPQRVAVPTVSNVAGRPVVIGAGPAGLFAAYRLTQAGSPPTVIERGPDVTERSKRWFAFTRGGAFDPEANLLYGEGGAGTYSDGKLYTRVSDPRGREVLEVLAAAGAPPEILYDAHPHIGSNLLPAIVRKMRRQLAERDVEFRFETRLTDLVVEKRDGHDRVVGVELDPGGVVEVESVFLGAGHSARDTYRMLADRGVVMEPKPFQMGVRVEHPQAVVDAIQYGDSAGHGKLPPAEYQWVARTSGPDVFSFCMCPGGEVLPATEKPGFICTNGASRYKRRSPFATSGFVVTVETQQFPAPGPLAGMHLQEEVERRAASLAQAPFAAPALRLADFLAGRVSDDLPPSSYPLDLTPVSFEEFLPEYVVAPIREGLAYLARRHPTLLGDEALVVAPESRSSSPLRLLRDSRGCESTSTHGLYPMGEGAGYAGGILSAAIDGMRCAEAWAAARTKA